MFRLHGKDVLLKFKLSGIWAPTLRYHDDTFWLVTTLVEDDRFADDATRWDNVGSHEISTTYFPSTNSMSRRSSSSRLTRTSPHHGQMQSTSSSRATTPSHSGTTTARLTSSARTRSRSTPPSRSQRRTSRRARSATGLTSGTAPVVVRPRGRTSTARMGGTTYSLQRAARG